MGADVRRPINVTTLAYTGSAEAELVPDFANECVASAGRSLPTAACNVDGDSTAGGVGRGREEWEEDWEEDTAARQAAVVACDDDDREVSTPKRQKTPKRAPPQRGQTVHAAAAAVEAVSHPHEDRPAVMFCVWETKAFLGARPGHEFKLGGSGVLGYYPTPDRLNALRESVKDRPHGWWRAKPAGQDEVQ